MSKFLKSVFKKKDKKTKGESDEEDEQHAAERRLCKEDFDVLGLLGKGAFGKVILVRKKDTGQQYAMKVIFKQNVLDNGRIQDLFSERSVLRRAKHPFIVHLEYTFQSEHKLFFVMEYLQGGDLDTYLNQSEGKRFDEEKARFYAAEVLLALQYLHEHNIIYRDLKPENILLDNRGHACLSDFGLSKDFEDAGGGDVLEMRANSFVGSPFYVSPDVLRQRKYGNPVDYWSFGVLLFRMLTGTVPFKGANIRAVFESILHSKVDLQPFPWVSAEAQDLIVGLLHKEEAKRYTGPGVKTHPFFNEVNWQSIYNKEQSPPHYLPIIRKPSVPDVGLDDVGRSPPTSIGTPQQKLFDGFSYANGPTLSASPQ